MTTLCQGTAIACSIYPDNKAKGCGKTVEQLLSTPKEVTDPTRVFHSTQTCIARKSCDLRCQMDNCKWMDYVIPDFVEPYLSKAGKWQNIEQDCKTLAEKYKGPLGRSLADAECSKRMASYHMEVDLKTALAKNGCGSTLDWNLVNQTIQECTANTAQEQSPVFKNTVGKLAASLVSYMRDSVRATCIETRIQQRSDTEFDPVLKGKTCEQ